MATLIFPLVSHFKNAHNYMLLRGDIHYAEKPHFSLEAWLSGVYQESEQKYLEEKLGLRNLFIRAHNQLYFNLFNEAEANGVIIGKDNYLFEENYIKEFYGMNFIGAEKINLQVKKIAQIQAKLKKLNKHIVFLIAPNKASFFADKIPDYFKTQQKAETNYKTYCAAFKKEKINFIDLSSWFISLKGKSRYPLYPKTGIHWSSYGQALFIDSLVNYLSVNGLKTAKFEFKVEEVSNIPQFSDDDIEQGMNLLFKIPSPEMAYPKFTFDTTCCVRSNALIVGDSYFWNTFERGFLHQLFNNFKYLYYNEAIYSSQAFPFSKTIEMDVMQQVKENDVLIVMSTEANLYKSYFGIVEDLYQRLIENKPFVSYELRLNTKINQIQKDKKWMDLIQEKAKIQGRPIKDLVREDAIFVLDSERRK